MDPNNQTPNDTTDQPAPAPVSPEPVQPVEASPAPVPVQAQIPAATANPGHGLGIASLVVSLLGAGLIGLILGIIGLNKSKKAGQKNGLALAGVIIGAINVVVGIIISIVVISSLTLLATKCAELGSGTHTVDGATFTCGSSTKY